MILHQDSELSGLPNAPDICGIPVLENHGLSHARVARAPSSQFREGDTRRVRSFEKPARSAQVEAWSRIQDRGSEFRTRDSGYSILIFTVLWKSESELRIIGNFNTN